MNLAIQGPDDEVTMVTLYLVKVWVSTYVDRVYSLECK